MPYKIAIFDLDGTLLDTLEDLYLAVNAALARQSLPSRTRDEVRMFVGDGTPSVCLLSSTLWIPATIPTALPRRTSKLSPVS